MSRLGRQVVATVDRRYGRVILNGQDVLDIAELAGATYRVLGSGAIVVSLTDLAEVEAACAARYRPIRIQSRRVVTG